MGVSSEDVKIRVNVPDIVFSIETSIPLGLIINEIISNSLKYAFKKMDDAEIIINLEPIDENEYRLDISDNGIGFPENIDYKNTSSLGMQLVNTLTQQLEGDIRLIKDGGTHFRIIFKEPDYKKRI